MKYSAGAHKKVSLSASVQDDRVELEVRDSGIGIPSEDLPRILEPSFTRENGRIYRQSTGMGSYLVHEAYREPGHSIRAASIVGKGTVVHLTLFHRAANLTSM